MKIQSVLSGLLFLAAFMMLSLSSCEGPQGPAGDLGPAGDVGPTGEVGPVGPQGLPGNYNVRSFTFEVTSGDWTAEGTSGSSGYQRVLKLNVSDLTEAIANNGLVVVYFQFIGDPVWYQLPYVLPNGSYTQVLDFWIEPGSVTLRVRATDNYASTYSGKARIVMATADGRLEMGDINWKDYNEVSRILNLQP